MYKCTSYGKHGQVGLALLCTIVYYWCYLNMSAHTGKTCHFKLIFSLLLKHLNDAQCDLIILTLQDEEMRLSYD